jgi:acetylornithine deacetylase
MPKMPQTAITPAEARALDALDLKGLVQCLSDLLRIPSVTGSEGENQAQQWFEGVLRQSGFQTDLWPIDLKAVTSHPDFPGQEVERRESLGLVGTWGEGNGPTLVFNGHIDVVPPGDIAQWNASEAYSGTVADGRVYGRGACDMKGGLICQLFAVKALQKAGVKLSGKILLESVVGEEDGGLGTFATLQRGYRGDAAIITEPTDLEIIPACAGALTFRLRLTGLSTHASVRTNGRSTIEKFWKVWAALEALEKKRNAPGHPLMTRFDLPWPLSIGTLHAGDWPSSVPDTLVAEGRLGVALGEKPQQARDELERAVAKACEGDEWLRAHPATVEWFGGQFASGQIPAEHPLIGLVSRCHQDLNGGATPAVHGAPYGSDLRLMVGLGNIPTLHYGPGNVKNAHAPNEHVPVAHLEAVTRALILAAMRFCGVRA